MRKETIDLDGVELIVYPLFAEWIPDLADLLGPFFSIPPDCTVFKHFP